MSKVLLISPPTPWDTYLVQSEVYPNGALLQLGSILKEKGHEVKIVHMLADRVTYQELPNLIKQFKPAVVGVTMVTFQAKTGRTVIDIIKNTSKNIIVAIGGPHISALGSSSLLSFPRADMAVVGEGDEIISRIAEGDSGDIIYPKLVENLDSLPWIDLGLTNLKKFPGQFPPHPMPSINIMGSRGCPFQCTFCSKPVFGNKVRFRDPKLVASEINYQHYKWGIKEFFFQDDTFNVSREWTEKLLDYIFFVLLHKNVKFRARMRVNEKLVDLSLLKKMKRAGFWEIFYGVENGNQGMLDSMKKGISIEEIRRAFRLTKEAGIKTEAGFIIGMPGETEDTIMDSVKLWKELKTDWCSFQRAIPFPGTELERQVRKNGHILVENYEDFILDRTLVRTDALTGEQLETYTKWINKLTAREKLSKLGLLGLLRVIKDAGLKRSFKRLREIIR